MLAMDTWWKDIFSGALAVGINEQKLDKLQDESFLYLQNATSTISHYDYAVSKQQSSPSSSRL